MSDEIVGNEPSSTEPSAPVASVEEGKPIENGSPVVSTMSPVVQDAPVADAPVISSPTVEVVDPDQTLVAQGAEPISTVESAGVVDVGNVAAAVEGGAPVTGDVAVVGADAELAASHAEWTSNVHPASALADQIQSLASALGASGDSMICRMGFDIKKLVEQIKAAL